MKIMVVTVGKKDMDVEQGVKGLGLSERWAEQPYFFVFTFVSVTK